MKIILHLRNQPEKVKRHILHVLTIVFAIILLFLWFYSLGKSLSNPDLRVKASNDLKPFFILKDNLVGGYKSISESNEEAQQ